MSASWDTEQLNQAPRTHPAPGFSVVGVEALFYEALLWQGRPTRAFAWMGMPEVKGDETCPGMVLVHGGGGTAFASWVRLWNQRGYAAIAMDLCGSVPQSPPTPPGGERERHDLGGPPGWGLEKPNRPVEDQWIYHAVADVLLGHSLLAAQPQVDPGRIGVTGISWGGFLSGIAAGVDPRFRFAVPVYGCGYLGDSCFWQSQMFAGMGAERTQRWLERWDPSAYLSRAAMPMCWVSGTNDGVFPLHCLQQSYRAPAGERTLCIRVEMPHAHGGPGENPEEIRVFADSHLRGEAPLARIEAQGLEGRRLWATFSSARPIVRAEMTFTRATGYWSDRKYNTLPAELDAEAGRVEAEVPAMATVCFFNLFDDRDCVVSTEHVEISE